MTHLHPFKRCMSAQSVNEKKFCYFAYRLTSSFSRHNLITLINRFFFGCSHCLFLYSLFHQNNRSLSHVTEIASTADTPKSMYILYVQIKVCCNVNVMRMTIVLCELDFRQIVRPNLLIIL